MLTEELLTLKVAERVVWEDVNGKIPGWVVAKGYSGVTIEFSDGLIASFTRRDPAVRLAALKRGTGRIWEGR